MQLFWEWDDKSVMVVNQDVNAVIEKLEAAGFVKGNDFLVRHPGWYRVEGPKRQMNGAVTALLFTDSVGGKVMAKMILE